MDQLRKSVKDFVALERHITDGSSQLFHKVAAGMHDLCFYILEAEKNGMSREKIDEIIKPARDIHSRSVFVKRLQEWPREYPGDFETIEYICNLENLSQYGKIEYYIEDYALNSAMAQQHRNKIQRQSEIILNKLLNGKTEQKILSVGCGGCRDILKITKLISDIQFDLVLYDIDNDALELSKQRLKDLKANIQPISGNFLHSLRIMEKSGPFDLILAGGLFDYISDKHISFFLKYALNKLLKPDSILFFTNIKKDNPYKVWQEYLADWKLVYRCEEDILALLAAAGFPDNAIKLEKDETGLTFLVTVKK
ncbi:MAG TPA: class I SAM-dependent methyltransferase [Nitrospirae bacterium]|nr:methyltransferase domain protein [bacterium BMS3Abin10]GBE38940.1 methyltransferase domain protein [bacterium BMS3Bbin08]HDH51136.1 class I SAM-dependent methyltransferase [Nitrospirota bacterium]HDK82488.1 class I SAM-dependent methyltransferase [Nitrospirota bacterium]